MSLSVFRYLVLAVVVSACSDRASEGDAWTFSSDMTVDSDVSSTTVDDADQRVEAGPDYDVAGPDGADDGGPDAFDVARADVGVDTPSDTDIEGSVTVTGWYSSAFEHSGFIPDGEPLNMGAGCDPYLWAQPPGENWWATGEPLNLAHQLVAGGGMLSRIRATGQVTPRGEYGHLGGYDREFTVESAELLSCEAAAAAGHCIFPRAEDQCVIPPIETIDPPTKRSHLKVTYGGPANSPISYELRVIHNENVGDGRVDAVVRWQLGDQQDPSFVPIDQIMNPSLSLEQYGIAYIEYDYGDLNGWVAYAPTGIEAWMVSISGTRDDGETLHVWGFFPVDEVVALP